MSFKRFFLPALVLGALLLLWSTAVMAAEPEAVSNASPMVKPAYPSTVESMIERRRDQLQRRRDRYLDARTGRRWRLPPWENAQRDWMDRREDIVDEQFRRRRDALELWHDAWGRWYHPWSQWRDDWNDARRNARELSRLSRDEFHDRLFYSRPWYGYVPY